MTPRSHAVCTSTLGVIQLSYSLLETHSPCRNRVPSHPPPPNLCGEIAGLLRAEPPAEAPSSQASCPSPAKPGCPFARHTTENSCLLFLEEPPRLVPALAQAQTTRPTPSWVLWSRCGQLTGVTESSCHAKAWLPVHGSVAPPSFRLLSTPPALCCLLKLSRHFL